MFCVFFLMLSFKPAFCYPFALLQSYFFKKEFLMWVIFKVFIELVTILLLFCVLVSWLQGLWDLRSLTRN